MQRRRKLTEQDVYRRDIDWLTAADVVVAEASGSSYGVGFEVGYVLGRAPQTKQRVVLLYDRGREHVISRLITGDTSHELHQVGPYGEKMRCKSTHQRADLTDRRADLKHRRAAPEASPGRPEGPHYRRALTGRR